MTTHERQHHSASDHRGDGNPLVPTEAGQFIGTVDAKSLDPEAPEAVADDVHRHQLAKRRTILAIDPQQHRAEGQAPEHFVEKGGMERRAAREPLE